MDGHNHSDDMHSETKMSDMTGMASSSMSTDPTTHSMTHSTSGHGSFFQFQNMKGPLLFKTWTPDTTGELVGACFAVAFMMIFYFVINRAIFELGKRFPSEKKFKNRITQPAHWVLAVINFINVGWMYLIMLVAMTFNGWLFFALLFGAFFGYLLFGVTHEEIRHC